MHIIFGFLITRIIGVLNVHYLYTLLYYNLNLIRFVSTKKFNAKFNIVM